MVQSAYRYVTAQRRCTSRTIAALSSHFFSTFHKKVTGATITPDKFDR